MSPAIGFARADAELVTGKDIARVEAAPAPAAEAKTLRAVITERVHARLGRAVLAVIERAKPAIERQLDATGVAKRWTAERRAEYLTATALRQERGAIAALEADEARAVKGSLANVLAALLDAEVTLRADGATDLHTVIRLEG